jgi:GntR family transcriptional repressor for pyruvate dehydrogenase complex
MVVQGELRAGSRLPSERDLAAQLGVSRTSLREAIKLLQAAGLLVSRHGQGVFVVAADVDERFHEVMRRAAPVVEPRRIRELYQVRIVLEGEAAAWAAPRIPDESLAHLRALIGEAEAALAAEPPDLDRLQHLDSEFHTTVFRATGNTVLVRIMDGLLDLLAESRRYSLTRPGRAARSWQQHRAIAAALAAHDPRAARTAMRRHVRDVERGTFAAARHAEEGDEPWPTG